MIISRNPKVVRGRGGARAELTPERAKAALAVVLRRFAAPVRRAIVRSA